MIYEDQLEAIRKDSIKSGTVEGEIDLALLVDGLQAEREQGITIDVAHIYFSTPTRHFIIADAPGHVEFTRNMVTGASTAQVSIILIDARKGVQEQTFRHFFINDLLRIKNLIVVINKMDLVDYDQSRFEQIKSEFEQLAARSDFHKRSIHYVPLSALFGDNITSISDKTPWYDGSSVLDILENLPIQSESVNAQARFAVQNVIRPKTNQYHDFRGFAGKLTGASLSVGDEIIALPSGLTSKVSEIRLYENTFETANPGSSFVLSIEDEINISRGDMIVKVNETPKTEKQIKAKICWMDAKPLRPGTTYLLQHGVNRVLSKIDTVNKIFKTDLTGFETIQNELKINQIGEVSIKLSKPVFYDPFVENRENGAFILIDSNSHFTSGVGLLD